MTLSSTSRASASLLSLVLGCQMTFAQDAAIKSFPTYRAAGAALVSAVEAGDVAAASDIIGPKAQDLLSSGDPVQDKKDWDSFVKGYKKEHAYWRKAPDIVILRVGATGWQLPFPIERVGGVWHFDADEGAQELVYRRIGQNELDAIRVCRALHGAQKTYAASGHDSNSPGVYAQRFRSKPDTENGLYWQAKEGEPDSPAGALIADATSDGYDTGKPIGKRTPFHGYFYRILKSQGANAPGGAKDYVNDGKMTGGFAILAYPAEYRASGVMSFVVGRAGVVYQRDLGTTTADDATSMTAFDPDSSWKKVP